VRVFGVAGSGGERKCYFNSGRRPVIDYRACLIDYRHIFFRKTSY